MKLKKMLTILVLAPGLMLFTARVSETAPMGTAITYQGRLMEERVGRRMDSTILSSNYSTPIKWVIREVGSALVYKLAQFAAGRLLYAL